MLYIIFLICGFVIGTMVSLFVFLLYRNDKTFGTLKTAYDDGEPYLFLDMDKSPEDIAAHKYVIFKVERPTQK